MGRIFWWLNEKGEYTGKIETREKCHGEGLWHKVVVVVIINSNGQALLQKRSANKKLWTNAWGVTAGGNVLAGEFGFQSILIEYEEKLRIKQSRHRMPWKANWTKDFNLYYICKIKIWI